MKLSQLKDRYEARIMAILNKTADALQAAGFVVDAPADMCGDEYQWNFGIHFGNPEEYEEHDIDVSFTICDSDDYDGTKGGVNFSISFVEVGGRMVGDCTPRNYTNEVWVPLKDHRLIEERFQCMEGIPVESAVELIQKHVARRD